MQEGRPGSQASAGLPNTTHRLRTAALGAADSPHGKQVFKNEAICINDVLLTMLARIKLNSTLLKRRAALVRTELSQNSYIES